MAPPIPSAPKLGTLSSRMSESKAEQNQQQSGHVHGQDLKREERQQQAQASRDARKHRAGAPQLDCQAERPERQQQVGDLWIGDRRRETAGGGTSGCDALRVTRVQSLESAIEACDGAAIELPQQIIHVGGDEVDERWRGVSASDPVKARLLLHGLFGEGDVRWRASASERRTLPYPTPPSSPSSRRAAGRSAPDAPHRCGCLAPWRRRRRRWSG